LKHRFIYMWWAQHTRKWSSKRWRQLPLL